jgi:hypothetical protein
MNGLNSTNAKHYQAIGEEEDESNFQILNFSTFLDVMFGGKVKGISKMHQFVFSKTHYVFSKSTRYTQTMPSLNKLELSNQFFNHAKASKY